MTHARLVTLCAVVALGACHRDSGTPTPPKAKPHIIMPVVANKGPTAEEQTAGMVEAASQGKSQAPVKLKFDLKQRPIVGQALDVDLALMPQIDASPADIQITGGSGLALPSESNQIALPTVEAGQVYRESIKVTPSADGVLLLSLTILLKHDEVTESRMFSIPVIVDR